MRKVTTMSSSFGSRLVSLEYTSHTLGGGVRPLLYPFIILCNLHIHSIYSLTHPPSHTSTLSHIYPLTSTTPLVLPPPDRNSMEMEYDERTSDNTHLIALGCPMYERDLEICQQHAAAIQAAQNSLNKPLFTESSVSKVPITLAPVITTGLLAVPCEVDASPSSPSSLSPSSPRSTMMSSPSKATTTSSSSPRVCIKPTESGYFLSKIVHKQNPNAIAVAT